MTIGSFQRETFGIIVTLHLKIQQIELNSANYIGMIQPDTIYLHRKKNIPIQMSKVNKKNVRMRRKCRKKISSKSSSLDKSHNILVTFRWPLYFRSGAYMIGLLNELCVLNNKSRSLLAYGCYFTDTFHPEQHTVSHILNPKRCINNDNFGLFL